MFVEFWGGLLGVCRADRSVFVILVGDRVAGWKECRLKMYQTRMEAVVAVELSNLS